jgi:glutaconate CoA-transferase, subunit A
MEQNPTRQSASADKVCTMTEAIRAHVHPGDAIFFAGMQHGEPSAAIHEIVRQRIGGLTVISALTHTVALLLGEGLLKKLVTAYLLELYEKENCLAARARRLGAYPELEELSHYGLSLALLAGQMGVPFMTTRAQLGSSFVEHNPNLRELTCPFTGQKLAAVRALNPDVGIIHTQRCDENGAAHRWGSLGMVLMGINACRKIVVTTEKIVSSDIIRRDPNRTIVPAFRVAAVIEVPWGAYPLHLAGCYNSDLPAFSTVCREEAGYQTYVDRYIRGVADRASMMELMARDHGPGWLERLKIQLPLESAPVIHGY